ncbi:MAG: 30S ribosomal protein S5 [bacterium]
MTEDKKQVIPKKDTNLGAAAGVAKSVFGDRRKQGAQGGRRPMGGRGKRDEVQDEFEQKIVDLARVTRVMAGGKRMRFRACVAVGNKKGKIAIGLAKGADVTNAISKAVNQAKKNMIDVPIINDTIPHEILHKSGAAKVLLKPAQRGRGIIAGGSTRIVIELSGVHNIICKNLGTTNKVNNAKCVIEALALLKKVAKKEKTVAAPVVAQVAKEVKPVTVKAAVKKETKKSE